MDYIIQPGDTLYTIARRYGVTVNQLLAANPQITNPNSLTPGQRITIPASTPGPVSKTYIIQPGDTLIAIARRYGITLSQLLAANPQLTDPSRIFPGQRLNIPQGPALPPSTTISYTIQAGDTLFSIAQRFGTTVETLLRLNPQITDPTRIFPGQQIQVPGPTTTTSTGCIVYVSTRSGRPELWRSDAGGRGTVQITRQSGTIEQPVGNPQWAPDGRFIAYQAVGGLFLIDPCGRHPTQLVSNVSSYSWSNDGRQIAFSNPEGTFITDLSGNARKVIGGMFNPVWFPGDQRLAGTVPETEEIRFARLATVDTSGSNFQTYDNVPARRVRLSPNGRYAATEFVQGFAYGVFSQVYVYDFNQGKLVTMPGNEIQVQPGVVHNVSFLGSWAPDSTRLVYSTMLSETGVGEIRIADLSGVIRSRFTRNYYPFPEWSPVAGWIMYTVSENAGTTAFDATPPRNIYVRNLDTNQEILIAGTADNYAPEWNNVTCPPC